MAQLNLMDYFNIEFNGQDLKAVELNGVNVWTRIDLPIITTQPVGGSVKDNQTFTASIVADGNGGTLSYVWFINNVAQVGSNSASYTFAARPAGTYTIRCEVTNERGTTVSNNATLTVTVSSSMAIRIWADTFFGGNNYGYRSGYAGSITPNTFEGKVITGIWFASALNDTYVQFSGNTQVSGRGSILLTINGASNRLTWDAGWTAYRIAGASSAVALQLKNYNRTVPYSIAP